MGILAITLLAAGLIGPLDHTVVSPVWLEQNLDNPDMIVVEIGSGPAIDRPHIPTARYVAIESIVSKDAWPPDELPPVDQLRQAFENAGVGDAGRIILYSAQPLYATRAWFTLDYLGQGYRTAILDGGFNRWLAEKRPVATKRIPHLAKTFTAFPDTTRLVFHRDMRSEIDSGAVLIDARTPYEFHGFRRGEQVTRRGHIPGAYCDPWQANLTKAGSFRTTKELADAYAEIISKPDARVVVYCRTGMEASMPYFVLRSLGYDVALYDGSYTEWSRDKSAPVTKLSTRR
jgi:thiosulfate/3-mercaptopyruvate sulfurtransferase